jgi:hypothetical protein
MPPSALPANNVHTHRNSARPRRWDVPAAVAVTTHRNRRRSGHRFTTLCRLPTRQVAPKQRLPGQSGVLAQPADHSPEGEVIDVAVRAFGDAVLPSASSTPRHRAMDQNDCRRIVACFVPDRHGDRHRSSPTRIVRLPRTTRSHDHVRTSTLPRHNSEQSSRSIITDPPKSAR